MLIHTDDNVSDSTLIVIDKIIVTFVIFSQFVQMIIYTNLCSLARDIDDHNYSYFMLISDSN